MFRFSIVALLVLALVSLCGYAAQPCVSCQNGVCLVSAPVAKADDCKCGLACPCKEATVAYYAPEVVAQNLASVSRNAVNGACASGNCGTARTPVRGLLRRIFRRR